MDPSERSSRERRTGWCDGRRSLKPHAIVALLLSWYPRDRMNELAPFGHCWTGGDRSPKMVLSV